MNKCPQCGYTDEIVISKFNNVMNIYVNEKGEKICQNTDQESFVIKGVKWTREDLVKPKAPTTSTPVVPTAPASSTPTTPVVAATTAKK